MEPSVSAIAQLSEDQVVNVAWAEAAQLKTYTYYAGLAAAANLGVMSSDLWHRATVAAHLRANAVTRWTSQNRAAEVRHFVSAARWAVIAHQDCDLLAEYRQALSAAWIQGVHRR